MDVIKLIEQKSQQTLAVVFSTGEEVVSGLLGLAKSRDSSSAHFTGIGALSAATIEGARSYRVGRLDGSTLGGYLLEAQVRPTLVIVMVESPKHLGRKFDPASGLALLDLASETAADGS